MNNLDSISLLLERIEENLNLISEQVRKSSELIDKDFSIIKDILDKNEVKKVSQHYPWNKKRTV